MVSDPTVSHPRSRRLNKQSGSACLGTFSSCTVWACVQTLYKLSSVARSVPLAILLCLALVHHPRGVEADCYKCMMGINPGTAMINGCLCICAYNGGCQYRGCNQAGAQSSLAQFGCPNDGRAGGLLCSPTECHFPS